MLIILSLHCQMDATHSDYGQSVCFFLWPVVQIATWLILKCWYRLSTPVVLYLGVCKDHPRVFIYFIYIGLKLPHQRSNYFCLDNKFNLKLLT